MSRHRVFCALALNVFLFLGNALPSVPVAINPILSTATVSTVVPSLVTIYSVVPATDAKPNVVTTVTTTIDGKVTTLTSTADIAGSVTSTIFSTVSLTTSQVVVNTIGYLTIFGPDPTTSTTDSSISLAIATSTSETSSTTISVSDAVLTTSSAKETSGTIAVSATSTASTSTVGTSTSSPAIGASNSPSTSSPSPAKGLSTGTKAGIGIATAIVIILLVVLSFLLGQRYSRRRNNLANTNSNADAIEEKDIFQAGRPYETTASQDNSPALTTGKGHAYSLNTTAVGSGSESGSGQSCDIPVSNPSNNHHDHSDLSALPPVNKDDEPMYVAVPAHMSGSKRWSMKEFMK